RSGGRGGGGGPVPGLPRGQLHHRSPAAGQRRALPVSAALAFSSGNAFQDQAVIVTGGSRGIGRAVSLAFAQAGANLVVNYAGNLEAARCTASMVEAQGQRCLLVPGSVADPCVADDLRQASLE